VSSPYRPYRTASKRGVVIEGRIERVSDVMTDEGEPGLGGIDCPADGLVVELAQE
jgi:hypothetical protein